MKLEKAQKLAEYYKSLLAPHCIRIEIAGSIRRKRPAVKDIEIVCIPHPYEVGLFKNGIALVIDQWPKVKGNLPCKYTQRVLPEGINIDIFFADAVNWGLIYAIRTGSAAYSHRVLATGWVMKGYKSEGGYLRADGHVVPVREELDLFRMIGTDWVEPELREWR